LNSLHNNGWIFTAIKIDRAISTHDISFVIGCSVNVIEDSLANCQLKILIHYRFLFCVVHLYRQRFGHARGLRGCGQRRGNSFSYCRGDGCSRCSKFTRCANFLTLLPQLIVNDMHTPRSAAGAPARRAEILTPLSIGKC
jgi:hypothetical protein